MSTVALQVFSCPKTGAPRQLVRFLANPRGILTHWGKGRPEACPGEPECRNHRVAPKWKGYASGQLWVPDKRLWVPVCVELTAGLVEFTGTSGLRGQAWELFRVRRSYGDRAVEGELIHQYNAHDLPAAFSVERTVEQLYRTIGICWDVPVDGWTRERAPCSADAPPARAEEKPVAEVDTGEGRKRFLEHRNRLAREINGTHEKT